MVIDNFIDQNLMDHVKAWRVQKHYYKELFFELPEFSPLYHRTLNSSKIKSKVTFDFNSIHTFHCLST